VAPGGAGGDSKSQGLPTYTDPAASGAAPGASDGGAGKSGGGSDVPQYTDPGAAAPASAPAGK
jgi:phospholipid-binding lipoprotein MlaA